MKVLLHICCAPCSVMCIETLRNELFEVEGYWYNINIHPYTEYKARLDTLKNYTEQIELPLVIHDEYGIEKFTKNVIQDLSNRCSYCYEERIRKTAIYAKEHGYDAFTSTLFISPYQKHDLLKETCERIAMQEGIPFLYRDFRPYFREGQKKAREMGFYMQKYCGCIFSEEERYLKIKR